MTAEGRIVTSQLKPGIRLVTNDRGGPTDRKTGPVREVAEVTSELQRSARYGSRAKAVRVYTVTFADGTAVCASPATTWTLAKSTPQEGTTLMSHPTARAMRKSGHLQIVKVPADPTPAEVIIPATEEVTLTAAGKALQATMTWGTVKAHGLKVGDRLWFGGNTPKAATEPRGAQVAVLTSSRLRILIDGDTGFGGGNATKFWAVKAEAEAEAAPAKAPAKATPAKAAKATKAPAKAAPAKVATPATAKFAIIDGRADFPVAPSLAEHLRDQLGAPVPGHPGYFVRYPYASYQLAMKVDPAADGPAWLAVCPHGNTQGAEKLMGGAADSCEKLASARKTWCAECATPKAAPAKAPAKAPAPKAAPAKATKAAPAKASKAKAPAKAVSSARKAAPARATKRVGR